MSLFISFEGPEGSGKTTHTRLLSDYLNQQGYETLLTREPGGTEIGEQIRELLLDPDHSGMDRWAELFLYLAGRAQHVNERIRPALERGEVVISDRFTDASLVYQGVGQNIGFETVHDLNETATGGLRPDITFILDIPIEEGLPTAKTDRRTTGIPRMETGLNAGNTSFIGVYEKDINACRNGFPNGVYYYPVNNRFRTFKKRFNLTWTNG